MNKELQNNPYSIDAFEVLEGHDFLLGCDSVVRFDDENLKGSSSGNSSLQGLSETSETDFPNSFIFGSLPQGNKSLPGLLHPCEQIHPAACAERHPPGPCPLLGLPREWCVLCLQGYYHDECLGPSPPTHPCERVWGYCRYGDRCVFRDLPRVWCLRCLRGQPHKHCDAVNPALFYHPYKSVHRFGVPEEEVAADADALYGPAAYKEIAGPVTVVSVAGEVVEAAQPSYSARQAQRHRRGRRLSASAVAFTPQGSHLENGEEPGYEDVDGHGYAGEEEAAGGSWVTDEAYLEAALPAPEPEPEPEPRALPPPPRRSQLRALALPWQPPAISATAATAEERRPPSPPLRAPTAPLRPFSARPEPKEGEDVGRRLQGLLNRITPETFFLIIPQLIQLISPFLTEVTDEAHKVCKEVSQKLFLQAVGEPQNSELYAELLHALHSHQQALAKKHSATRRPPTSLSIRTLLLNQCQQQFYSVAPPEDGTPERAMERTGHRQRALGNAHLVAEMYLRKLVPSQVIDEILTFYMKDPRGPSSPERLEVLCTLLRVAGPAIRWERPAPSRCWALVEHFSAAPSTGPRMRFLLQDVVERRARDWAPRPPSSASSTTRFLSAP